MCGNSRGRFCRPVTAGKNTSIKAQRVELPDLLSEPGMQPLHRRTIYLLKWLDGVYGDLTKIFPEVIARKSRGWELHMSCARRMLPAGKSPTNLCSLCINANKQAGPAQHLETLLINWPVAQATQPPKEPPAGFRKRGRWRKPFEKRVAPCSVRRRPSVKQVASFKCI